MPTINFTNPFTLLVAVILFALVVYLAKSTKKSWIIAIMLFSYLCLLIGYTIEYMLLDPMLVNIEQIQHAIIATSALCLIFVLISFLTFLWVDDIEAKMGKRKSIDNSLDWFWKQV